MDIRTLTVFLSVADTLSFSRSGSHLHLSVSAVSRSIARLEQEIGQPLFERDTRRVHLTRAGEHFREYARGALADWQAVKRRLGGEKLEGEVRIFCSVTASHSVLAPILAVFRGTHPGVEVVVHTGDQADGINRVLDGLDDIAVSSRPAQLHPRLSFLSLLKSRLRFCVASLDCEVRDAALDASPIDWQRLPLIVPDRGVTKDLLNGWLAKRGIEPQVYAQVAGHEAIVAMAGLGFGIGVAPQLVIESSGMAQAVEMLPVEPDLPTIDIGLCCLSRRLESLPSQAFWAVAEESCCRTTES